MNLDLSLVESLNRWGATHVSLTTAIADDTVFLAIALSGLAFLYSVMRNASKPISFIKSIALLVSEGIVKLALPVGLATIASELISKLFVRSRPFAAYENIVLVFPQAADGGMPSHHMTFTIALGVAVMFFSRKMGFAIIVLAIASGIGRIAAGIHYPSDILAGALLGTGVVYLYKVIFKDIKRRASL
jgi:undecaprenyl-diphosphatase